MYSPQLLDHFENPRHVGEVVDANARAETENPVCGDVLRLTLRVDAGQISEARFKAKGCVPAMACASALAALVWGKTVAEARALRREDVISAVGGVPEASTHAAQLAIETLWQALRQVTPQK